MLALPRTLYRLLVASLGMFQMAGWAVSWNFAGVLPVLDTIDKLLTRNRIFMDRTVDVGVISKEDAIAYGMTGPNLRASGVDLDLRKDRLIWVMRNTTLRCQSVQQVTAMTAI